MHNFRSAGIAYEDHGIGLASINSYGMRPENFDDDDWVESVYLTELHRSVCAALGAKDMIIFDWMLRKRAPSFPVRKPGEENEESHQPSLSAYIDYTTAELASRLDPTTVDRKKDLIAVDEVFPTVANEVYQVRWNPNHRWNYIPDQLESEVAIFNTFDSEKEQSLAVPHCSFDLGDAEGSAVPRQSIKVRAFIFS
ncbi:hypothetical protein N657DRAFT_681929 [Parathielavia appendiculata]|uniref:Uncharacterized protein n=1 Tax=Parathielavia appendiculata TaxID=2587402 RepID=A0AAN6TX23_9PEZI|nr:hypothetical protein N657DRAFT_681929 [Parathielavia appendiculata]